MTPDHHDKPSDQALAMRGDRFAPLRWEQMTPAQQQMTRNVLAGARGSMQGPYNVLLRSPELGNLAQQFGAQTRFHSSLPLALNELAILLVARHWTAQFVWHAHRRMAVDAGLDPQLVLAIAHGHPLPPMAADVAAVYHFCDTLIRTRQVDDACYAEALSRFGERGIVDLMATMSYYTLVSMALNVDRYPLPEGATPELLPL